MADVDKWHISNGNRNLQSGGRSSKQDDDGRVFSGLMTSNQKLQRLGTVVSGFGKAISDRLVLDLMGRNMTSERSGKRN